MKRKLTAAVVCGSVLLPGAVLATTAPSEESLALMEVNQENMVKLTIIDATTKEPVIGATILNLTTEKGNVTDFDGIANIAANTGDKLQVSYVGYKTQVVTVSSQRIMNISLAEDSEALEEVVVTAFGTGQKKETIVGSIQTVRPEQLRVPSANISNAFAGRMAGVVAFQRSGQPGQNSANFYIRGISTLSGVTSPLIILDGVEISSGDLNTIDPEIIEGFSILKDATATAMYGTRGANGVMIVTTKKGIATDRPIIGFRVESYVSAPTQVPKFVDGPTYMNLYNEAVTQQGTGDLLFTPEQIAMTQTGGDPYIYPNVDWYNEIFKTYTFNQKANFNIRGGSEKLTYFMNVGAVHETGMLQDRSTDFFSFNNNIDFYRYTFQNNFDFKMTKTSTIALHLNVQLTDQRAPSSDVKGIYNSIMNSNPVDFPTYYPNNGSNWVYWGAFAGGNDGGATNPLAQATSGYSDLFSSTVIANLTFDQKLDMILDGLSFKALFSFKNWNQTTNTRSQGYNKYTLASVDTDENGNPLYNLSPLGTPSRPILGTTSAVNGDRKMYYQAYLDYNKVIGSHNFNMMALFNGEQYDSNVPGNNLINSLPKRKLGFAGRASYSYANRYMLEINAGYNGSENFAKGNRFGFFPSAALGWTVSEERFFTPLKNIISYMKLRGSYGFVGNDQIGGSRFIYLSDINLTGSPSYTTGYGSGNTLSYSGPAYTRYQNDNITWEIGEKTNIGADFQLFDMLNITVDAFRENRSNIFQKRGSIPNYLGVAGTVVYGNLAKVQNYGIDGSFDIGKQFTKDFSLQFKGTYTFARNKVIEYDEAPGLRPALSQVGRSLNVHMGYVSNGLFLDYADIANNPTSTIGNIAIAPGDVKYVDQPDAAGNYDGQITTDDRVALGYPTVPEIVYGFGPSMQYKKLDFSFFFQGVANTSIMMSGFHPFGTQYNRNVLEFVAENRWSQHNQNPDAEYPRLTRYDNNNNTAGSDFWLRDGSFLKLKNVELGYNFKRARVYVGGTNLLTFSPFKYWDPEMGGGAGLSYPTQRVFNIGAQVTLR